MKLNVLNKIKETKPFICDHKLTIHDKIYACDIKEPHEAHANKELRAFWW